MNQQSISKKNKFVSLDASSQQHFFKAEKFLELSQKLCSLNSVDEIIKYSVYALEEIFNLKKVFFVSIASNQWVIQVEGVKHNEIDLLGLGGPIDFESKLFQEFIKDGLFSSQDLFSLHEEFGVIGAFYFPIFMKGQLCGALSLIDFESDAFTESELKLVIAASQLITELISRAQLIEDLQSNNEELLGRDRSKSQLMSTISHELRTPLTNIIGFSELLLRQTLPEDLAKQYIQEINNSANRLSNLIHDFLDLSKVEATGKIQLGSFEEVEIDWLAEEAWAELASQATEHKIKWNFQKDLPRVYVDSDSIKRVFINIFANAIKYSEKDTEVTCSLQIRQKHIVAAIKDQGMGIQKDMLNRVFDPFFRVDNSYTRKIGGTGLGLAICKEIINSHGGQIWCNSEFKKGSEFIFMLPIDLREIDINDDAQIWLN